MKMKLNELKVKSFVTELETENAETVKGGTAIITDLASACATLTCSIYCTQPYICKIIDTKD